MPARSQRPVCSSITAEGTGTPDDPDRIPYAALASESQTAPGARAASVKHAGLVLAPDEFPMQCCSRT